jgi:hypothetical protein
VLQVVARATVKKSKYPYRSVVTARGIAWRTHVIFETFWGGGKRTERRLRKRTGNEHLIRANTGHSRIILLRSAEVAVSESGKFSERKGTPFHNFLKVTGDFSGAENFRGLE